MTLTRSTSPMFNLRGGKRVDRAAQLPRATSSPSFRGVTRTAQCSKRQCTTEELYVDARTLDSQRLDSRYAPPHTPDFTEWIREDSPPYCPYTPEDTIDRHREPVAFRPIATASTAVSNDYLRPTRRGACTSPSYSPGDALEHVDYDAQLRGEAAARLAAKLG